MTDFASNVKTVISIGGSCSVSGGVVAAAENVLRSANENAERIVRACQAELQTQDYVGRIKVEDGIDLGDGSVSFHVNLALDQPTRQLDEEGFWRNVRVRLGLESTVANSATNRNDAGACSAQTTSAVENSNSGLPQERHQVDDVPLGSCSPEDERPVVLSNSAPFQLEPAAFPAKEIDCATCVLVYAATLNDGRILPVPFNASPVDAARPDPLELGRVISESEALPARIHIVRRYEIVRDEDLG